MSAFAMWMILYGGWLQQPKQPTLEERMKAQAEWFNQIEQQRGKT
jgi:hypothetical protein